MAKEPVEPHLLDAVEWRSQAQTLAVAAVQLAEQVADGYGVELELRHHPAVELRVKGKKYRVGGGLGDPRREPPELLYARSMAANALSYEQLLSRRIAATEAVLAAEEQNVA